MELPLYDTLSEHYDRFVNWPERLAAEMPFLVQLLHSVKAQRVLDAACGTGMHSLALAALGYHVVGADLSTRMIGRARSNAAANGREVRFEVAGFGGLHESVGGGYDALLCLGSSLPHVLEHADLKVALADFGACLRPQGLLLIQNRNFDRVLNRRERWMEPQTFSEREVQWLFVRFYDFEPEDRLAFHMITLWRRGTKPWQQRVTSARIRAQTRQQLVATVRAEAFSRVRLYGSLAGAVFEPRTSPNLVLAALRKE